MKKSITTKGKSCFLLKRNSYAYCMKNKYIVKINSGEVFVILEENNNFVEVFVQSDLHKFEKLYFNKLIKSNFLSAL